jgi:hypothetical protein
MPSSSSRGWQAVSSGWSPSSGSTSRLLCSAFSCLSLLLSVSCVGIGELCALPGVVASNIRRGVHLCRPCICVVRVCAARLCSCPALGRAIEEPVTVRQPLYFDYTEAQPSATVTLGGALEWEVWCCWLDTP